MSTVPIISPAGDIGDIPFSQLKAAIAAGAKPGVSIKAPDGSIGVVPADRYQEASRHGATVLPYQEQDTQHPGFWATAANLMGGLLHPSGFSPYPGMDQEAKSAAATQAAQQDQARKEAGYSLPYRAVAPVAQSVGVNVPAMEQSAKEGDVGGVAAGAVVPVATLAAGAAVAHGAPALSDALSNSPTASRLLKTAGKTAFEAATDVPVIRKLAKVKANWDATAPKAGGGGPELDATGENKAFAGGMDEAVAKLQTALGGKPAPAAPPPVAVTPQMIEVAKLQKALGGNQPAAPAAAAPVEAPPPVAAPPVAVTQRAVQSQLENALGGKPAEPLIKGVSLRNQAAVQKARSLADLSGSAQNAAPTAGATDLQSLIQQSLDQVNAKAPAPVSQTPKPSTVGDLPTQIKKSLQQAEPLPEGFTPVDSSALKGYKYSPDAREFESITNDGRHYVHGDVSPEEAQTFEDADSKGKAWTKLKSQNPLVAKVLNGKRVAMTKSAASGGEDLSTLLGESLKQAQMRKLSELQ